MRVIQVEKLNKSHDNDTAMGNNTVLYKTSEKLPIHLNIKPEKHFLVIQFILLLYIILFVLKFG